jgi:hypothetical protein
MPTGFDENDALKRMKMDSPASSGPFSRGGIAAFGRQMRLDAEKPKTDYVTMLENQAKMHAFRSGLKMSEMDRASELGREESQLSHEQDKSMVKAKTKSERKVIKQKAKSELKVAQGKSDITNASHAQYLAEVGGTENRSFEVNPSTGALKYGVPIKGIGSNEQFSKVEQPVNLEKYDK